MTRVIFGFPVHNHFTAALDLYYSIKKFNNNPLVMFSSNNDLGKSIDKLKRIKNKRKYRLGHMHNFLFDVFEEIIDMDFDYFVKLDSDCLFANYGFDEIFNQKFDFTIFPSIPTESWRQKGYFRNRISHYENILHGLNLERRDEEILGCLFALCIFSKRAVSFMVDSIDKIEKNAGYRELMSLSASEIRLCEPFIFTLLKDAGFSYICSPFKGVRYRPYWKTSEIEAKKGSELETVYHPVRREPVDEFRKLIVQKAKLYDKSR